MVPSLDALPDVRAWRPEDAKLVWRWKEAEKEGGHFVVTAFGGTHSPPPCPHLSSPPHHVAPPQSPLSEAHTRHLSAP